MTPRRNVFAGRRSIAAYVAAVLLASCCFALEAQTTGTGPSSQSDSAQRTSAGQNVQPAGTSSQSAQPTASARRRAVKLFLQGDKLYVASDFASAMHAYQQAAQLDPTNTNYAAAVVVARNHQVTALVQTAAKARLTGDEAGARAALAQALELDPTNPEVAQHLFELGDAAGAERQSLYAQAASRIAEPVQLAPAKTLHSFHVRGSSRNIILQVFTAYGITAALDDSVRSIQIRFDIDDAGFVDAMRTLSLATGTFYVPLDAHRALVARDTAQNRVQFSRMLTESIHLDGLEDAEIAEVNNLAKNVFNIQVPGATAAPVTPAAPPPVQPTANPAVPTAITAPGLAIPPATPAAPAPATAQAAQVLTLRATANTLNAFNATLRDLLDGRNQVMLNVRLIQLAQNSTRNIGLQLPQSLSAANVYSEEQSILNANQALVQQIISSGLASPGDTLAILGILLASGQVSSSLFSNGFALFGGGLTASALSPGGPATFNFNLNSSDSRLLDNIQLRLGDGEAGTLKLGERYPIQTSSYSSVGASSINIPGLTGAGSSSSLSSLLSSLGGAAATIPQIQYQDLGMTLKVTPKVLRGDDIALTIDMKLDSLAGSSLNGNPILDTQDYSSVVTLKQGETVEVASELNKSQSRAVSGTPGLSQIPGMSSVAADNTVQKNYATMVIVITPYVVRGTQAAGHTPVILVDKSTTP